MGFQSDGEKLTEDAGENAARPADAAVAAGWVELPQNRGGVDTPPSADQKGRRYAATVRYIVLNSPYGDKGSREPGWNWQRWEALYQEALEATHGHGRYTEFLACIQPSQTGAGQGEQ